MPSMATIPINPDILIDQYIDNEKNLNLNTDNFASILMQTIGGVKAYTNFLKVEDINQIPYHEEMGPINKTVLKSSDGTFIIDPQ